MPPVTAQPPALASPAAQSRAPAVVRIGDLRYRARVHVRRDSGRVQDAQGRVAWAYTDVLHNAVTVTNLGRERVVLRDWPGCFGLALRVWPSRRPARPAAAGAPAWDEVAWRPAFTRAHGGMFECDFARGDVPLAPGASYTTTPEEAGVNVTDVLGDSLPAGRYRPEVRVRRHTDPVGAAPTLRLAAPDVVLRRGRYDLPLRRREGAGPAAGAAGRGTRAGARGRS